MAQGGSGGGAVSGMGDGPTPLARPQPPPQLTLKTDMMRPSQYKLEMCMSTAERHRAYSDKRELDRLYAGHRPYRAFTVIPHRIVFQKFGRCDTQEQQVIFRNDDCIPHLLRVMPSMSPYISVTLVSAQGGKLAPGMFVAYRITFRPEEQCDYYYELQCTSDQVTFSVPIMAIGPRAILDFPDRIVFQNHPVNAETSKLLSVKNVGQKAAKFSLNVAKPFSVEPRCGTLPAGAVAQVAVRFLPTEVGQHCQHAPLTYDNGEKVVIEVHGTGVEVDVGLSNYTIRMDTTFIGLTSRKTFRLYNKSATPATFVWRRLETAQRPQVYSSSAPAVEETAPADPSLVASLTAGARVQLPPPPPALRDEDQTGTEEQTFQHPIFSIEPLRGEVWPDSAVDITAIFQPDSEGETDCIAYCQVTGRASRLPLHISGHGRGADVQLSLDSLDIGAVFKNSVFNYEVVAVNRGDIAATLQPLPASSAWARHITFLPSQVQLHPKDHRTLVLTLDAQILGQLDERFSVQVSGASRPLSLHLRGRVIPPTLEFDSALLEFGAVAFGFRKVLHCRLKNTSLVPVEFSLSVPDDGSEPAIRQEKLAAHLYQVVKKGLSSSPREFSLKPSRGVLQPQSSVSIRVELVPNTARRIATRLRVDIDGVKEALYSIPVSAECVAADVHLRAPDVLLGRHFKGRSADGAVTLVNRSPIAARFFLLPQESMEFPGVTYRCEEPTGVIEPRSTATVPFTVKLEALGSLTVPIRLLVFGRPEPLQALARVVSQGPVIDIQPPSLDWGLVHVLTPHHKTVTISNQAPVPANVTAVMRSGSYWTIEPSEATIGPEQTLPLRLTAVLDDPLRFYDVLVISVQDSGTWEIPVAAQGRGSSILFEPPLKTVVDLGPVFCKSPMTKVFSATNKGRRYHQLVWSNDGVVDQSATSLANLASRGSAVKLGRRTPGQVPVFRTSPRRVDMYPGETHTFTLEAYCESVGWRREELSCTAMIGASSGKTVLKRLVVAAEFIKPIIEFSRREIKFERKQIPGVEFTEQMAERLTLTNNSPLALTTHIRTQYPFLIRNLHGGLSAEIDYELGVHRSVTLEVLFDPDYETGLTSRYVRDKLVITYEEHPHCDEVILVGIVSFPNLVVSDKTVEFGCILNDMESFRKIKITNCSKVPVQYHWYFVENFTELDWLPETRETDSAAAVEAVPAPAETPLSADCVLQETRVDRLITQSVQQIPVECAVATREERLQALQQRRQSRYVTPPPPVDRTTAAEKLETLWKKEAAINEILDIYPLRGKLQPGDNTSVVFKFYGHGSVRFSARAVCAVLGGPQYPVTVSGRASSIRYRLEQHHVECGGHLFCQFLEAGTTLYNTGQVEFQWRLTYQPDQGRLQVSPTEGTLQAGAAQRITIQFLPMVPEYFERHIELAVAHFPPELITVTGHGAYPAVMLDLPLQYQDISETVFLEAVQNISAVLEEERRSGASVHSSASSERMVCVKNAAGSANPDRADQPTTILFEQSQQQPADRSSAAPDQPPPPPPPVSTSPQEPAIGGEPALPDQPTTQREQTAGTAQQTTGDGTMPAPAPPTDPAATETTEEPGEEQGEQEEPAGTEEQETDQETPLSSSWSVISHTDSAMVDAALIDLEVERLMTVNFIRNHPTTATFLRGGSVRRDAVSMDLLKYCLDFGLVLLGSDLHRAITVTNISQLPVTLSLITSIPPALADSELRVYLEDESGPLQPGDSTYIQLRLRPSSLEQPVETMQKMIYLEVKNGLFIPILLKATVTAPIAELDEGELGFGTVYVGQCRVCQLKVHNNGVLPAAWSLVARPPDRPAALPFSSGERPRRKAATAVQPPVFTFEPCSGLLLPDQWAVVNVIFAPAKSKVYVMEAALSVQGASQTWLKRLTGEGLDSSLEFSSLELAFDPIVPYNDGGRMEVTIFNRHPMPVEIFSLEFDRQYLEEEHQLRTLTAYDEFDQVIMPPRRPGEPLSAEVRAFYTELVRRAAQPGRSAADSAAAVSSHGSLDVPIAGPAAKSRSQLVVPAPDLHGAAVGGPSLPVPTAPSLLPLPAPQPALQPGLAAAVSAAPLTLPAVSVSPSPSPSHQLAEAGQPGGGGTGGSSSDGAAHGWPGWVGVLDQPIMWTLPAQEQFIRDYHELCMTGTNTALPDPVAQAILNYISSDQPADHYLTLSRKAPAFVIISAPYTEPYLLAVLLAERYGLSVLTVDQLVWQSLLSPTSAAAHRARDYLFDSGKQGGRGAPPTAKQPANSKRGQSTAGGPSRAGGAGYARKRSESDSSAQGPDLRDLLKPRPLPPGMMGELIAARLMEPDISSGVVFWDIHGSQFSTNVIHTVMALLLGLGKRKHAYFLTMDRTATQHIEKLRKLRATNESGESRPVYTPPPESVLLACDELEYAALTDRDRVRLALLMRRARQKRTRERRDEVRRLQEQLRQEHEKKNRKGKVSALHKQLSHHNKLSSMDQADPRKPSMRKQPSAMSRMSLRQPRSDVSIEPHDRRKRGMAKKKGDEDVVLDERQLEEEKLITAQFKAFHDTLATLVCLLDVVDRDRLVPEGMPAEDTLKFGATQHKRSSKNRALRPGKNSTLSKRATTVDEFRVPTDLGVTHVLLDGSLDCRRCYQLLVETGVLPSPGRVRDDMGQGSEGPPLAPGRTFTVLKRPPPRTLPEMPDPVFIFRLDEAERAATAEAAAAEKEEKSQRVSPEKSPPPKRRGQRRLKGKRRSDPSLAGEQRTTGSVGGECDTDLATAIRQALHRDDPVVSGHRWVVPAEGELRLVVLFEVNRPGRYQARLQLETVGSRRRYTLECSGSCVLPLINRKIKTLYAKVPMRADDYGTEHGVAFIRGTRTLSFGPLPVVKPSPKQQAQARLNSTSVTAPPAVPHGHQAEILMENISPLPAEITFHLFNESLKVPPFQLWPMSLSLAPGEKDHLQVMALPPAPQQYEDMLIGCVKDNPDPWITKLSCIGAKPEVHVDKKQLTFDRVLLLRRETRRLVLNNRSLIPLQFRVADTEQLGEGFVFRPREGTLLPLGISELEVEFSPIRPCVYHNKKIKLEITEHFEEPAADEATTAGGTGSDNSVTNSSLRSPRTSLGILQSETITVSAEGFDVAVDLMFPKGLATGVDFGTIKVKEESKQTFTIKNKGKYEIMFKAWLEDQEPVPKGAKSLTHGFHLSPDRGILHPHERPLNIQMWFSTDTEIWIKKTQMLRVQILDFHKKEEGEVIALIPVGVSVRALFCKYSVTPSHELHLGHFPVAVRKTGFFVIKNDGKFDFSYHIVKKNVEPNAGHDSPQGKKRGRPSGVKGGSSSSKSNSQENTAGPVSIASVAQKLGGGQSSKGAADARAMKLMAGIFSLQPAMGTIPVNSQTVVNVEAVSSDSIADVQELVIRISDAGDGVGIPFRLLGNVTAASIRDEDGGIVSIFEEHAVVDSLKSYQPGSQLKAPPVGVYGRAENRFQLSPTLLGDSAQVSFKVHNTSMVPVDVVITVKPPGPATVAKRSAVADTVKLFDISPSRSNIPVHGFLTVTVTFTPNALQTFVHIVDIQMEEPTGVDRSRGITFEVSGEGTLPLLDVLEPSEVTRQQEPLLYFLSTRLGDSAGGTVRLRNSGLVQCMVDLLLPEGRDLFTVVPDERTLQYTVNREGHGMISCSEFVLGTLCLPAGGEAVLGVTFRPREVGRCSGLLQLSVNYNAFQRQAVRLDGHGYNSGVLLRGLPVSQYVPPPPPPPPPKNLREEPPPVLVTSMDMPQLQYTLEFVSCYIGATYRRQFRVENCSDSSRYRFEWHNSQYLTFCPAIGHLAPREVKTVTVSFVANEAINFEKATKPTVDVPPPAIKRGKTKVEPIKPEHSVSCVVTAIAYPDDSPDQQLEASSWDERSRTMQLVPAEPADGAGRPEQTDKPPQTSSRLMPEPEPAFEELLPSPALRLDVPAVLQTDLARVRFTGGTVSFSDTFMFQARTEQVTLENVGLAEVRYSWSLEFVPPSARPVSAQTQVYSGELDSQTSVAGSSRSDSGATFLQLMSRRIAELADYVPFTIEPAAGSLPPGQTVTFAVRFAPLDTLEYCGTFKCSVPYLSEESPPPSVSVHGCGVLPVCHFDLDDTGCREGGDDLTPPSNCDLRVVTIDAVGVNRKVTRTFRIINPTESSWHYTFTECSRDDRPTDAWFSCANASGMVNSGQRARVTFEFFPRAEGTFESRWQFFIREHRLSVQLVLVGRAREPVIYATEPVLRLPAVLTGTTSHGRLTLVNEEEAPLRYQLDLDSCYSASQALRLVVLPIEGVVPARGAASLQLQYLAVADGAAEFSLHFTVETRHAPLQVAVSTEGYTLQAEATLLEPRARGRQLSPAAVNQVDLGLIPCRETVYRAIEVVNTGRFPFTVELVNATESPPPRTTVTLVPEHRELVEPHKRVTCKFGVCCASKVKFANIKILVKVVNGPCFVLLVRASAEPPNVWYSHSSLDFGPCFLHQEGMPTVVSELRVENRDKHQVSVGVELEDAPYLKIDFKQTVIAPGEKVLIPVVFVPLEVRRYLHTVNMVINGQVHRALRVTGQGVRFQVEVANSEHKQLVLADFRAGQRLQRSITVVNRADAAVRCQFQLSCSSPGLQNLASPVLRLRPAETELRPRGSVVLELQCFSKTRLPWFQEQVRLTSLGISHTLLTVEGACQGMELRLDVTSLPFGSVAAYSKVKRNVCIINDGDIGARFRWPAEPLQPEFTIWPTHGYAAAKSRVVCEVTMHPRELSSVIKKEGVTCDVENYGSLPLTLTGCCVPVTVAKEPLQFVTPVRTEDVRTIHIPNKTNTGWEVVPVVSGQFWRGQEVLKVPGQSVGVYSITYQPMVMTAPGLKHAGSVFLALPDGQALLYSLVGTAEPPLPAGRLTADIASKSSHQQTVDVTNWLTEPQRFTARAEVVRGEKDKDKSDGSSVRLSGLDYLDVPALATLPYTLTVYCYREGSFHVKLTFRNEESGEFLYYDLGYRVVKTHDRRRVELHTAVRRPVRHSVLLERPLDSPMTCQVTCTMPELILGHHGTVHFPPGQEARISFEVLPLREGCVEAPLDVHSQELGTYGFEVSVTARRPPLAGTVRLTCALGQTVTRQVKYTNYSRTRAEYTTQLVPASQLSEPLELNPTPEAGGRRARGSGRERDDDKPKTFAELLTQIQSKGDGKELTVDRAVYASPGWPQGLEASLDLTYEPIDVGSLERGLVLSSPNGGEYRFAVHTTCTLPEPQGPLNIKSGGSVVIPFKNIFPATAPYSFYVDSPYFSLSKTPDAIRAKKDIRLTVSFDASRGPPLELTTGRPVTACLTISGPALPRGHTPAWRYYLRGLPAADK